MTRSTRSPAALAALLLGLVGSSCARSDAAWIADLDDPDPFVRGLSAIGLAVQSPERARPAVPVLLETIDRSELGLGPAAAAALEGIGPHAVEALLENLVRDELMTTERRQAVLGALIAAGPRAVPPVVAALRGSGRAVSGELGVVLVRIGPPSVDPLVELLLEASDPPTRDFAGWLLVQLAPGAGGALPRLRAALPDVDPAGRVVLERTIAGIERQRR